MKMTYQKPTAELATFEEAENIMVSAVSYGVVDGSGWFTKLS